MLKIPPTSVDGKTIDANKLRRRPNSLSLTPRNAARRFEDSLQWQLGLRHILVVVAFERVS